MSTPVPELSVTPGLAAALSSCRDELGDLAAIEASLLTGQGRAQIQRRLEEFSLQTAVKELWADHDHVVVRGLPCFPDGSSALVLAAHFFSGLRTYRGGQVVKHFKMSPWTTALSHTLADGHFHSDLNTAEHPPAATVIQCVEPDPGAPEYGQTRIARVSDLVAELDRRGDHQALRFLRDDTVSMVNDTSTGCWTGKIVEGTQIRFHPETLRAAQKRYGTNPPDMEECLEAIRLAAVAVSMPIVLNPGDALLLSNHRTLHYRSACSVRFRAFPREFDSRVVAVFHTTSELQ